MSYVTLQNEVYRLQSESRTETAVEIISREIQSRPDSHELYHMRAQCLLKLEKFKEAASDASRSVDLNGTCDAHVVHGKALFNLGKFVESLKTFTDGKEKAGPELTKFNQFEQWMEWCEERIKKLGLDAPKESPEKMEDKNQTPQPSTDEMPVPKIKHDWYQTETHVIVTILIKNQKSENVQVEFTSKTVSVTAPIPSGSEYSLELDLCHPVSPSASSFKVVPSKIEVKMKKVDCIQWTSLEGDGTLPPTTTIKPFVPGGGDISKEKSAPVYPSSASKKHDWNKIEAALKAEEETEKLEGDAALNQLFQKIYGQGSDETKRAMNKSFMESGGTVLSTNWKEVGTDKVDVKPPDGVEYKKWKE